MLRKLIIASIGMLTVLAVMLMAASGDRFKVTQIDGSGAVQAPSYKGPCTLTKTNSTAASYWGSGYEAGIGTYTYFNPGTCPDLPPYPFEITDFSFVLYDDGDDVWPAQVDIVVYDLAQPPDSCSGPGTELCRYSVTADQTTFGYPTVGTFDFPPGGCCVNGPFYIGLEYTSGVVGSTPSVLYDDNTAPDTCDNWMLYNDGLLYEWYNFWDPPVAGYPIFFINGETNSPNCTQVCDWKPGDPYKHHFPQMPDETGWAVNATQPMILAEDFMCMDTGWIKDFHFWGAWKHGDEGQVTTFVLSIHEDIPAHMVCDTNWATGDCDGNSQVDAADLTYLINYLQGGGPAPNPLWIADLNGDCVVDNADVTILTDMIYSGVYPPVYPVPVCCDDNMVETYSRPGTTLWELYVEDFDFTPIDPPTEEGWYDPATGEVFPNDHIAYWQYNICLPEQNWFWQDSGTIYWVNISAIVADPQNTTWGWKSTQDHWNDDAVWATWGDLSWIDIWEPMDPQVDSFWIAFDPSGAMIPQMTGGAGYYDGPDAVNGWWLYEQPDWQFWNIWFYDHPFTYDRKKEARIEFAIEKYDDLADSWLTFVVNYSTDQWSLDQPADDSMPPLPGMPWEDELLYIGRDTLYDGPVDQITGGHFMEVWEIKEYNPEWISIDVWGYNFVIPEMSGVVFHDCIGSLDLSLVVTNGEDAEPTGACCYDDATGYLCVETTEDDCVNNLFGIYEGNGTVCLGLEACCMQDGNCMMADALCCVNELGGVPQGPGSVCTALEACCFTDGSCQNLDPLCCDDQGGVAQGPGTTCTALEACCLSDGSCAMLDPLCCDDQGGVAQGAGTACTATQACCFLSGSCQDLDPLCCDDLGGWTEGVGSVCLGDGDGDGIDDACYPDPYIGACCLPDGTCQELTSDDCLATGGAYMGDYTMCAGDHDSNGVDDACEDPWNPDPGDDIKMHFPQLPDENGWDVDASWHPIADDFMCTESGYIKDIHFWGSWRHGATGEITKFNLAIYSDQPAGATHSMPLDPLWVYSDSDFVITKIYGGNEGWFSPIPHVYYPGDHQEYYQYDIYIPEDDWFPQDSGRIYWLVIWAILEDPNTKAWGWKTSLDHWNDMGTFIDNPVWPVPGGSIWSPLIDPINSLELDLAFAITGSCCVLRGNVDHVPPAEINIADLTYLVAYLFTGGPPPPCLAEADVNGDGELNIADLTYLVAYLFTGGPPPVPC
ncbi:MAG: dockerin type I repeat-containing protein [candidate division Zixibacteria bacterium]|nr:dockerin type I repeat-containing protein [candidate division Zixibacteria bacterium]